MDTVEQQQGCQEVPLYRRAVPQDGRGRYLSLGRPGGAHRRGGYEDVSHRLAPRMVRKNALTMLVACLARGRYVVSVQNPLAMSEHGEPQPEHVLVRDPPPGRLSTPADVVLVGCGHRPRLRQEEHQAAALRGGRRLGGLAPEPPERYHRG